VRVFKSAWFVRFARAQSIPDESLRDAVRRADRGQVDAHMGGGVIKQRIAKPGQGRSGSYRAVVLFCEGERAFFVYGFAKSDRGNLREDEKAQFKKMAGHVLALTDDRLNALIACGGFQEVSHCDEEIPE
jgi:hypothetical protein